MKKLICFLFKHKYKKLDLPNIPNNGPLFIWYCKRCGQLGIDFETTTTTKH